MKSGNLFCATILLVTGLAATGLAAGQNPDETEIRRIETGLEEAWNHHDMKAWASFFAPDADFVNVSGWWWKGRAEIEKKHTEIHAYIFRDSRLTVDEVVTRFLTADTAIVHMRWTLTGHLNADGTPGQPRKGIFTEVLEKRDGKWLIAAAQNTDSRPEVAMPTGPPKN